MLQMRITVLWIVQHRTAFQKMNISSIGLHNVEVATIHNMLPHTGLKKMQVCVNKLRWEVWIGYL